SIGRDTGGGGIEPRSRGGGRTRRGRVRWWRGATPHAALATWARADHTLIPVDLPRHGSSLGRALAAAFAVAVLVAAPQSSTATTYFVRAAGDDAAAGNSRASAWRSLARVNEVDLEPGDRILLEGRATFHGRLGIG